MCGTADPKSQDQGREVIFSLLLKEFVVSVVGTSLVVGVNTVVSTVVVSASVRKNNVHNMKDQIQCI